MIDALASGKLHAAPVERTSANGKAFATAKLICATGSGESLFLDVLAFAPDARAALLALGAGDSVAIAGPLSAKVFTDRNGEARPSLSLIAHAVLSPYTVQRRRKAAQDSGTRRAGTHPGTQESRATSGSGEFDDMRDDL